MKKQLGVVTMVLLFLMAAPVYAQQVDAAFAGGTIVSPAVSFNSLGIVPSERGGTYVGFNGDVLIKGHLGVQGEVNWRASQGIYGGEFPFRPLFWDFNGIYARRFSPRIGAEVLAGIGGTSIRFYQGSYNCDYYGNCTNYVSSNHFMADVGGGLRLYVFHNFFVRPEARLYMIHNNVEFSSGFPVRVGASIGYTFGGGNQ